MPSRRANSNSMANMYGGAEAASETLDVCVLIPYYNNLDGLVRSLGSIKYHAGKYLVLVVDDGSATPLVKDNVLHQLGHSLPVHILNCKTNGGITKALNTGLEWIKQNLSVTYIARLDCGDICRDDRFYKQVHFLEANPSVGLLGSWCRFESPDGGVKYNYVTPVTHKQIVKEMHLRNVFIHPTVMFRTALLHKVNSYPENYDYVEDYAFFWESLKTTKGAMLNELLVRCEINAKGISISGRKRQLQARMRVVKQFADNHLLKVIGTLKLRLMLVIPYSLILKFKQSISSQNTTA